MGKVVMCLTANNMPIERLGNEKQVVLDDVVIREDGFLISSPQDQMRALKAWVAENEPKHSLNHWYVK